MQDWELEEYLQRIHDTQLSTKRSLDEQWWQQNKSKSESVFSGKTKFKIFLRVAIGLGAFAVLFFVVLVGIGLIGLIID